MMCEQQFWSKYFKKYENYFRYHLIHKSKKEWFGKNNNNPLIYTTF
jgi:hypothetical protein